jgi:hypothetical protein
MIDTDGFFNRWLLVFLLGIKGQLGAGLSVVWLESWSVSASYAL